MRKYAQRDHRKLYPTVVATSGPRRALPSLNPSDDSHERSREIGRKCGALGAAKCTHAQTLPSMYTLERPSSTSHRHNHGRNYAVFLMNAEILSPRPLCQSVPGGNSSGQAIYKRFHAPKSRDIPAMKKTDINSREFIRAAGVCEIFYGARARISTEVFLGIYRH